MYYNQKQQTDTLVTWREEGAHMTPEIKKNPAAQELLLVIARNQDKPEYIARLLACALSYEKAIK